MRASYRNPKELATALKDVVDSYLENLLSEEDMVKKILKMKEVNGERMVRNDKIEGRVALVLGKEREEILNKILNS